MKVDLYHTNKDLTHIANFKKLRYWNKGSIEEVSANNIDDFMLDRVRELSSITFIGDSIVTITKQNIESIVFSD